MAGHGQIIIDLDRRRMQAMAKKDIATLDELIAEDLIYRSEEHTSELQSH